VDNFDDLATATSDSRQRWPLSGHNVDDMRIRSTIYTTMDSPLGELLLVGRQDADAIVVTAVRFAADAFLQPEWSQRPDLFTDVVEQLTAYFRGERTDFEIRRDETAGTAFQRQVWAAVDAIPYGTTISYGRLAERIGVAREQVRAVGAAIGANPLLIVRPCHRVIGSDGALTGYAGGLERKRQLLTAEGSLQPQLI
jgi:methylated-DNA-[protein]-cysteine S-methyltransferase